MTFKYFDRPEIFTGLREQITTCDTCGKEKFCFDAEAFVGSEEITMLATKISTIV